MFLRKLSIILFLLFFHVLGVSAQVSVTINDYGTYFIDNGVVKKFPTVFYNEEYNGKNFKRETTLTPYAFWRNYIVFYVSEDWIGLLYNINNGAISDVLFMGEVRVFAKCAFLKSRNENILFHNEGLEYELDSVTLRTINKKTVDVRRSNTNPTIPKDSEIASDWYYGNAGAEGYDYFERNNMQMTNKDRMENGIIRCQGENFYLDLTINKNFKHLYVIGGKINRFVLVVGPVYPYGH